MILTRLMFLSLPLPRMQHGIPCLSDEKSFSPLELSIRRRSSRSLVSEIPNF